MRSQRSIKIPLKFNNFVHSINNTKTNKRRNASKNKGKDTECNSVDSGIDREEGDSDALEILCENDGRGDEEDNGMDPGDVKDSNMDCAQVNSNGKEFNDEKKSFVEAISENLIINDRKLKCILTELDENRVKVVVFDEVLVAKGIKRWDMTLCGFFVGYKMSVNELRYNLRRMWSRFGFKYIVDYNNGVFFMKFQCVNGVITSSNDKESPNKGKKKKWSMHKYILEAMKRTSNKFTVFEMYDVNEQNELKELHNKEIVDEFLNKNVTPKESDMVNWDLDMIAYYKQKMELLIDKGEGNEEEDVLEEMNYIAKCMKGNDVKGMDDGVLGVCYFGDSSEKIMIGWNENEVSISVIHMATNGGLEKKDLWRDLEIYRRIVRNEAWFLSGDMNVTLASNEHSMGGSTMSSDMKDFKCRVNSIEVEDVKSSGLFFTWTKNLQKCVKAKRKPFKFANFITEKEEFMSIVNQVWGGMDAGCKMFRTVKNMRSLKKHLKDLAWKNGDVFENVKKLRESVKEIQQRIDKDPRNNNLRSEEAVILKEYSKAMKEEELILYQKAKVKWLSVGDRNNAYFHKAIKSRQQRNRIDVVCDEFGKRFEGSEVAEQFVSHFQKFFGKSKEVEKVSDMERLLQNKLSNEDAAFMIREVCDEEIKSVVGKDVCLAVKEFFGSGKILKEINSTLISLVPKIQTPQRVSDFRPIACCNVIYKCISKILTEMIKGCLDKLVSKNQSALIPNRHIQDNIMLAQELFKGYDRKMGPKRVALKVDIQKAYDTVNWQFLEDILRGFGFHSKMVNWIMKCVTTTSFSICVNEDGCGYFKGGRGLRQGDPMSPYLFTLVMDILTMIIKTKDFSQGVEGSIEEFGKVAGLIPNYNKRTIIFGCLNNEEKQEILEVIPFKVENLPIRYFGVPLTSKRIRIKECKSLIEKVESRVFNWKNKCLSYAGRLMLVASVLESIHVYWASVIFLPDGVIKDINKILKDFLWNQNDGTKGRPKVAWKKVCRSKQKGGLGLKDLGVWNRAMIIKHLWHIITDKESLWVKWIITKKLKGRSIWEMEEDKNDSWGWRNILQQRNDFIKYRNMYDGRFSASMTVEDWMDQSNGIWPEGWIDKFPSLQNLQNVRLDAQTKDIIKWRKKDGSLCNFSVNHTYRELLRNDDDAEWWKIIWFSLNIPKHAFIVWLAVQNKLTTQDKIKQWGSYDVMCCALCRRDLDSHSYLFFECDYSKNGIVADMSRKFNGNSINSIVRRLCFAASVYLVWQERNSRIFRDEARSAEELFKILIDVVRMRLLSLKVK
ncbi:RNA-directed DNA polymerase, eukaryota, reverse transcriptase zinc-binding domain protein, partial [Tanacetum coccineum]